MESHLAQYYSEDWQFNATITSILARKNRFAKIALATLLVMSALRKFYLQSGCRQIRSQKFYPINLGSLRIQCIEISPTFYVLSLYPILDAHS